MPAKVQSMKCYLIPGQVECYVELPIPVDSSKCHIIAQHWNYSDQPVMISISPEGKMALIRFLKPFKYSWVKRLFRIKPYLQFSIVEMLEPAAPAETVATNV